MAVVESIGPEINTHEDEFAAFPSVNYPGKYYFSAVKDNNEGGKRNAEGAMDKRKDTTEQTCLLLKKPEETGPL